MVTTSGVVYDKYFENHTTGIGHPEQSIRATRVYQSLLQADLLKDVSILLPTACTESTLSLVHDLLYLSLTKKDISSGKLSLSTGDTHVSRGESWLVDRTATGAGTLAVNHLFSGKLKTCILYSPPSRASCYT